ncbi:MAG: hypothetical protein JO288_16300 [Hyphomicrobiales bacterium]|nr:hypothetical protein [Hyphomicrobiales bacterium]
MLPLELTPEPLPVLPLELTPEPLPLPLLPPELAPEPLDPAFEPPAEAEAAARKVQAATVDNNTAREEALIVHSPIVGLCWPV